MIRITVESDKLMRGGVINGIVHVDADISVPELKVEFREVDRTSAGDAGDTRVVLANQLLSARADLTAGQQFPFSLNIPADVVRGYSVSPISRSLHVRTKAGIRKKDRVDEVEIHLAPSEHLAEPALDELTADLEKAPKFNRLFEKGFAILAVALGIAIVVYTQVAPSSASRDAAEQGRLLGALIGGLFAVCGLLMLAVNRKHTSTFECLSFETETPMQTPGTDVEVVIQNTSREHFAVAFEGTQRWMYVTVRRDTAIESLRVFSSDWGEIAPGENRLSFKLDASAPPSHGGDGIGVDYQLRVVHEHNRDARTKVPSWTHRVLVG